MMKTFLFVYPMVFLWICSLTGYSQYFSPTWYDKTGTTAIIQAQNVVGVNGTSGNANSVEVILPGQDGYISYRSNYYNVSYSGRTFGLSPKTSTYEGNSLKYGIVLNSAMSNVRSRVDGVSGSIFAYTLGDELRLEKVGTTLYFKLNGVSFRTLTISATDTLMVDVGFTTEGFWEELFISFGHQEYDPDVDAMNNAKDSLILGRTRFQKLAPAGRGVVDFEQLLPEGYSNYIKVSADTTSFKGKFTIALDTAVGLGSLGTPMYRLNVRRDSMRVELFADTTKIMTSSLVHNDVFCLQGGGARFSLFKNGVLVGGVNRRDESPLSIFLTLEDTSSWVYNDILELSSDRKSDIDFPYTVVDSTSYIGTLRNKKYGAGEKLTFCYTKEFEDEADFLKYAAGKEGWGVDVDTTAFYRMLTGRDVDTLMSVRQYGEGYVSVLDSLSGRVTPKRYTFNAPLAVDQVSNATWDGSSRIMKRNSTSTHICRFKNDFMPGEDTCEVSFEVLFEDRDNINAVVGFADPAVTRHAQGLHIRHGFVIKDVALRVLHEGTQTNTIRVLRGGTFKLKVEGDSISYIYNDFLVHKAKMTGTSRLRLELFSADLSNRIKVSGTSVLHRQFKNWNGVYVSQLKCDQDSGHIEVSSYAWPCGSPGTGTLYPLYDPENAVPTDTPLTWEVPPGRYMLHLDNGCFEDDIKIYVGYNVSWDVWSPYVSVAPTVNLNGLDLDVPPDIYTDSFGQQQDRSLSSYVSTHSFNNSLGLQSEIWGRFSFARNTLQNRLSYGVLASELPWTPRMYAIYHNNSNRLVYWAGNGSDPYDMGNVYVGSVTNYITILMEVENGETLLKLNDVLLPDGNLTADFTGFPVYLDYISHQKGNIRDAVVSFGCWNATAYPRLSRQLQYEDYRLTNQILRAIYYEDYHANGENLNYKIFASHDYPVSPWGGAPPVPVSRGENLLEINCSNLPNGHYILEAKNKKEETFYLRFLKQW